MEASRGARRARGGPAGAETGRDGDGEAGGGLGGLGDETGAAPPRGGAPTRPPGGPGGGGAGAGGPAGGGAGRGPGGGERGSAADRPPTDGSTGLLPDSGQNHRALRARAARERPPANRDLGKRAPGCAASARISVKRIVFGQLLRTFRQGRLGAPIIAATIATGSHADTPRLGTRRPSAHLAQHPACPPPRRGFTRACARALLRSPTSDGRRGRERPPYLNRLSSSELHTTDTLERAMAAPASAGARMPTAASGIMMQL